MEPISLQGQRARIECLARLIAERAQAEASVRASNQAREATIESQFTAEADRLAAQYQRDRDTLQRQHTDALAAAVREYEIAVERAASEHDRRSRETIAQAERALKEAQEARETARDAIQARCQEALRETARKLHEFQERLQERKGELAGLENRAARILRRRWCTRAARASGEPAGRCDPADPLADFSRHVSAAASALEGFREHTAARFMASGWLFVIFIFTWIGSLVALVASGLFDVDAMAWGIAVISGTIALGTTALVVVAVRPAVVRQSLDQYARFRQCLANARKSLEVAGQRAAADADNRCLALRQQCERDLRQAEVELERRSEAASTERKTRLKEIADNLQAQRRAIAERRQARQEEINQWARSRSRELQQTYDRQRERLAERHQQESAACRQAFQRSWERLARKWREGLEEFQSAVDAMNRFCAERFPEWGRVDWQCWTPPAAELPALRFGEYLVRLDMFDHGIPDAEELRPARDRFALPAAISFAERPSLLLEAWGEGRAAANRALRNVMLRFLTSLPPAKTCFTIIDPVGLGQNFSAFMHLADFDEKLVHHRIWTETPHINQRLADLTEHMEDVIQTYLRNEFRSIGEYNRQAGEVAEPFHVLVVANFPAGFSDEAAQRLVSIVSSGARCGVYALISTDGKLGLPRNFDLADLEACSATLQWNGSRFCWLDEELKDFPLTLDEPPDDERLTDIIRAVGRRAKEASRVEVPFSLVAARPEQWWAGNSRAEIDVPLGRAGASKLQHLRLGKGTSQHVLISGKTGSGKSTLLHVLITNTALRYAPQEIEFYLIDFKKGVEFKPYAALRLPHARVVAIESEREFGMSVLERLDLELHRRGDRFRELGVQDIQAYRDLGGQTSLPRVLLIIDEFQEFFVQDDKLAQDAALLLDRLIRQGRAFGIHVLLGSQTLAGAYSLARSTIGQMAIRIALQCSEADSHLILSEDNTAARLLRRPGEAIYNDANGLFEGNHPFQVVWLPASEQETYLRHIAELAASRNVSLPPPIVFEGNAPANPAENDLLRRLLAGQAPATDYRVPPRAWLGAAVSIKDPTAATFPRQSGANLLLVGQQEDAALGILANSLLSLAAVRGPADQPPLPPPAFRILDGSRPEAPEAGLWPDLARRLPLEITVRLPAEAAAMIQEIAGEVARRQEQGAEEEPPLFLLVFHLSRFRDLRRSDEDFGFSGLGDDRPRAPDKLFAAILRDGPAVGVHALVWCDTFSNVNRWFDRQMLRDLNQRVLFQMSATDSSNLMDSPEASRLGLHRAILYSEDQGRCEKFRPYGLPAEDWLAWVRLQLERRRAGQS